VLRRIIETYRRKRKGPGRKYAVSGVIINTVYQALLGCSNQEDEIDGTYSRHGKEENCIQILFVRACLAEHI
jgi:hypothetical protein